MKLKTTIAAVILIMLTKCTAYVPAVTNVMSDTAHVPHLTNVNSDYRNIIGYEQGILLKKRMYYTVTDPRGRPEMKVRICREDTIRPIGGILISKFDLQH